MSINIQGLDGRYWIISVDANGLLQTDPGPTPPTGTTGSGFPTNVVPYQGMSRSDIIADVKELTEHKADQRINFERLFTKRLQKFCQAKPYWWRKKMFQFSTVAGQSTYDLFDPAVCGITDFEMLACHPICIVSPGRVQELSTDIDPYDLLTADLDTSTDIPTTYTIDVGTHHVMRLMKTPNGAYTVRGQYYAIPNPPTDESSDIIPIVPSIYHHVLFSGLKMDVMGFLYGVKDSLYTVALGEYKEGLDTALARPAFSTDQMVQFIIGDDATRSTPGN